MATVLPTPRFACRTVQVPAMGPVNRPSAVKPFEVADSMLPWLLENGYVTVFGDAPIEATKPAETAAAEEPSAVIEESPEPTDDSDDDPLNDDERLELLIALDKLTAQEIADLITGVGLASAKKIKRSPLTEFEQLESAISKPQLKAVIAWYKASVGTTE